MKVRIVKKTDNTYRVQVQGFLWCWYDVDRYFEIVDAGSFFGNKGPAKVFFSEKSAEQFIEDKKMQDERRERSRRERREAEAKAEEIDESFNPKLFTI